MQQKPNILLIYTDQQRFDTIAALGNPVIRTPNLDRLIREGTVFTHATTPSPVCMPARWSLMSGQWTSTHQCYSNHHPGKRPQEDLVGVLKNAGYRTGISGKNHSFLKPQDFNFWEENPKPIGDEEVAGWIAQNKTASNSRLVEEALPGGIDACTEKAKTDKALEFMDSCKDQPFFLWLSYIYPHTPYEAPEPFFSMYKDADIPGPFVEENGLEAGGKPFRQLHHQRNNNDLLPFDNKQENLMKQVYYGMISLVDAQIGRILDYLDQKGISKNTLLVFTSDHGDYMGDHGLLTKSPALYDCLVRIPMIFRWTGRIDAARKNNEFVSAVDLMPTFLAAANAEIPKEVFAFP